MSERAAKEVAQLALSEKDSSSPRNLIAEVVADIKATIPGLLVDLSSSGKKWFRGKSNQEVARAEKIVAEAIDRIGRLALDERDQAHRHAIENENQRIEAKAKDVELYLSSLERIARIVREFADAGIDVDIQAVVRGLPLNITDAVDNAGRTTFTPIRE